MKIHSTLRKRNQMPRIDKYGYSLFVVGNETGDDMC